MQFSIIVSLSVLSALFSATSAAPIENSELDFSSDSSNSTAAGLEKRIGWGIKVYQQKGCKGTPREWTGGSLPRTDIPLGGASFLVTKTSGAMENWSTYSSKNQKGSCYNALMQPPGCCITIPFASMRKTFHRAELPDRCVFSDKNAVWGPGCVLET